MILILRSWSQLNTELCCFRQRGGQNQSASAIVCLCLYIGTRFCNIAHLLSQHAFQSAVLKRNVSPVNIQYVFQCLQRYVPLESNLRQIVLCSACLSSMSFNRYLYIYIYIYICVRNLWIWYMYYTHLFMHYTLSLIWAYTLTWLCTHSHYDLLYRRCFDLS